MHRFFVWIGRLLLAGIFILAAVGKLADPQAFAKALYNYRMLPEPLIPFLAIGLPVLEAIASIALFIKPLQKGASLIFLGLLIVFIIAIASAWARGLDVDCGCFGEGSSHVGPLLILRNIGLSILAIWSYLRSRSTTSGAA
ncbi:MAG: DoxX family membrane protein [Candidatus Eisenbacteria bacterium]|nr:DoxX family membrane protein [Candidatus Eisenbacteria bacterium]